LPFRIRYSCSFFDIGHWKETLPSQAAVFGPDADAADASGSSRVALAGGSPEPKSGLYTSDFGWHKPAIHRELSPVA